jgi:hypothetical protein
MAVLHNLQRTVLYWGRYSNRPMLAMVWGYQSGTKLYDLERTKVNSVCLATEDA